MSLGQDGAAGVLKHLGPKEVERIGTAMATVGSVSQNQLNSVLTDFSSAIGEHTSIGVGTDDYVRSVLIAALGESKATNLIDRILAGTGSKGLESLRWMDARGVADVVRSEHPQIVAIVLSYLDSDHAAGVMSYLPDSMRPEVMMRIASLESIQPNALQELDDILERQFAGNSSHKASVVGGAKAAADILNFMGSVQEEEIVSAIREQDDEMGTRIQELMFTFDNLLELDDRSAQRLLRDIEGQQLVLALKGAEEQVKEKFLNNMSKRAREMLVDDLESTGPVKVSDVEAAQKEVLATARRLSDEGEIALGGKSSEQYL